MSNTYHTMNKNEIQELSLILRNDDETPFIPTTVEVNGYDNNDILLKTYTATVSPSGNEATIIVGTEISKTPGKYYLIWKIVQNSLKFYHKTLILVLEL